MPGTSLRRAFTAFALALVATTLPAQTYKLALKQLSTTETYRALVLVIAEAGGFSFDIQTQQPGAAIALVEKGEVDAACPGIVAKAPTRLRSQNYDYSTTPLYNLAFVLYTNKSKSVDMADLKKGNTKGYNIDTDTSNTSNFEFNCAATANIEQSLRKVDAGTIDGLLYSQTNTDPVLKKAGFKNIRRQLYDTYEVVFALPKGARGGPLDKALTEGIRKLKESGKFDRLMGPLISTARYSDWQQ
jgi:ABC-type amino acid transport substrate-binding protein